MLVCDLGNAEAVLFFLLCLVILARYNGICLIIDQFIKAVPKCALIRCAALRIDY